jgi:hypothetical protein
MGYHVVTSVDEALAVAKYLMTASLRERPILTVTT